MGEQRKKINSWRYGMLSMLAVFVCLMLTAGVGLVDFGKAVARSLTSAPASNVGDVCYWGIGDSQWGVYMDGFGETPYEKTYTIGTRGQLANLSHELTYTGALDGAFDYSGYTFILSNDIDLEKVQNTTKSTPGNIVYDYPLWLPIDVGNLGKNQNIVFDGNGYSIKGMHIVVDDKYPSLNVGFFANIIGGVIKNVNFVNPVIEYNYSATSYAETDANRPSLPTDVCVGVVAGSADSTYIQNVNIINPTIKFTTDNVNAHNFYVGTAVGKSSFTTVFENVLDENGDPVLDEDNQPTKKISSINTVSSSQWGLDTVNVYEDSTVSHTNEVGMTTTVNLGDDASTTFGKATYGYFGGLVGANISSKVINSTIHDYSIITNLNTETTDGIYHVGGLVGLTTQITTDKDLIVAAGLYNNLLLDVNLGEINTSGTATTYCGNLVGRVYSGGWVYNNLIAGGTMPYGDFWGQVYNTYIFVTSSDDCVGHILGALDSYYFDTTTHKHIGDTDCLLGTIETPTHEVYYRCETHQKVQVSLNEDGYGSVSTMSKYNYYFENWTGSDSLEYADYTDFISTIIYTPNEEGAVGYSQLALMSSTVCDDDENVRGSFYAMSLPILKYELGLTVSETDAVTGNELSDDEKMLASVYQFRRWGNDGNNHNAPVLGDYFGTPCELIFITDNQSDLISEAYYLAENAYDRVHEKTIQRTYQQLMVEPSSDPICEGYDFVGWKLKLESIDALISNENNSINSYADVRKDNYPEEEQIHLNEDGTYDFAGHPERITADQYTFVAVWKINTYTAYYMVGVDADGNGIAFDKPSSEDVVFGRTLQGVKEGEEPTSDQGYVFAGWYLKENLPGEGEELKTSKKWKFGQNGYTMPDHDIELYAGWLDNFSMLRDLVENDDYKKYNDNYDAYFSKKTGNAFHNAYVAAEEALAANDVSNVDTLLSTLKNTFKKLRVDPQKLLNTRAFDDSEIQNACPFLYDSNFYLSYTTFKATVENYASLEDDDTLANIAGYITYYEKINELFDSLNENLKTSVAAVGGVESDTITALIEKYQSLEARYAALYADGENEKYDTTALDSAEQLAKKRWTEINKDLVLKDVETVVTDYEKAFNNLQVKSVVDSNTSNASDGADTRSSKSQFSPIVLSIVIVSILAAGVFGYIGIDFALNKRRTKELKVEKTKTKQAQAPDEDTYI